MATLKPTTATSVEQFINTKSMVPITYTTFLFTNTSDVDKKVAIPIFCVLDDYIDEINEYTFEYTFTSDEYSKYVQAPRLLAEKLYSNQELFPILLRINDIYDERDFTMHTIKLISRSDMNSVLAQIYNCNKRFINVYNDRNNQ